VNVYVYLSLQCRFLLLSKSVSHFADLITSGFLALNYAALATKKNLGHGPNFKFWGRHIIIKKKVWNNINGIVSME
jgi:hypothetical protein